MFPEAGVDPEVVSQLEGEVEGKTHVRLGGSLEADLRVGEAGDRDRSTHTGFEGQRGDLGGHRHSPPTRQPSDQNSSVTLRIYYH